MTSKIDTVSSFWSRVQTSLLCKCIQKIYFFPAPFSSASLFDLNIFLPWARMRKVHSNPKQVHASIFYWRHALETTYSSVKWKTCAAAQFSAYKWFDRTFIDGKFYTSRYIKQILVKLHLLLEHNSTNKSVIWKCWSQFEATGFDNISSNNNFFKKN